MPSTESSPSIAAYHRQLSNHLSHLLRSTGSTKPSSPLVTAANSSAMASSASLSKESSHSSNDTTSPQAIHASCPPPLAGKSTRSRSTNTNVVTPPHVASDESRQAEQKRAWNAVGSEVSASLPRGFNLVLTKPTKSPPSSSGSTKTPRGVPTGVTRNGVKGLGIDLHVSQSQDLAMRRGLLSDTTFVSNRTASPGTACLDRSRRLAPKPSMDSLSIVTANSNTSPQFPSRPSVETPLPVAQRRRLASRRSVRGAGSEGLRDPMMSEDEKLEDYEARREYRMKKRQGELFSKIASWRDNVQVVSIEVPEIEPTPPTPSISSGMLRLSPFGTRPTALPSSNGTGSANSHFGGNLRALDALLGDMTLKPRQRLIPSGTVPTTRPLRIVDSVAEAALPSEGMPTPRPPPVHGFTAKVAA